MAFTVVQAAPTVHASSLTTASVTLPSPTTAGNTLIACVTTNGNTTNPVISGVTIGGSADNWVAAETAGGSPHFQTAIWYDPACTGGQTAVVVTCTGGAGANPAIYIAVYEVQGVLAKDKVQFSNQATGTTWTSGTTATTTIGTEIFFGVCMASPAAIPAVTGAGTWTTQGNSTASFGQVTGYQQVTVTTTATFSGTTASGVSTAAVATFSAGAVSVTGSAAGAGTAGGNAIGTASPTASIGGAGVATATAGMALTGKVVRSGTQFLKDGQPWRLIGFNMWRAPIVSWNHPADYDGYEQGTGSNLATDLAHVLATAPHVNTVRVFLLQQYANNGGARDWSALDHVLSTCDAVGIKVIATLQDGHGYETGTGSTQKTTAWYTTDYKTLTGSTLPYETVSYRSWVQEIITRYAGDPRIAIWEIINEGNFATIGFWTDVSGLIKGIDPLTPVCDGSVGTDSTRMALSTLDCATYHYYTDFSQTGYAATAATASAANKPTYLGEAGFDSSLGLSTRASDFSALLSSAFATPGISGFIIWQWNGAGSGDSFNMGTGDPTLPILDTYAPQGPVVVPGPVGEDNANTPAPTTVLGSLSSTAVSNSFTPQAGTLAVVTVNIGFAASQPAAPTVTLADSAGNNYVLKSSAYDGVQDGCYIFAWPYVTSPGAVTVTVTRSVTSQAMIQIAPRLVLNTMTSQAGAGTASLATGTSSGTVVQSSPTVQVASLTGPLTATLPQPTGTGNSLVACITTNGGTTLPSVSSITLGGAAGNWQAAFTAAANPEFGAAIWYDPACAAGQTSVVLTCSGGAGTNPAMYLTVYEVTGTLAFDQGAFGDAGGSTTWTSTATAATTTASEIFFGVATSSSHAIPTVTGVGTWTTQGTAAGTFDQVAGYQNVSTTQAATFSGTSGTGGYTALVATFSSTGIGGSPTTAVNGTLTAAQGGSLVYVTATASTQESPYVPVGSTLNLTTVTSITDDESAAVGRLAGDTAAPGVYAVGWTVPTPAQYSLAALEVFGTILPPAIGTASGAGAATATALVTNPPESITAAIAGAGTATAVPTVGVLAPTQAAGAAIAVVSGGLVFVFGTAAGSGVAVAVATVGTPAQVAGAGAATAVPTISAAAPAAGAGVAGNAGYPPSYTGPYPPEQISTVAIRVLSTVPGAGVALAGPVAAGAATGAGAATAVPTLPTGTGTAQGAGAATAQPTVGAAPVAAGSGTAGAPTIYSARAAIAGAGRIATAGTPASPTAAIAAAGVVQITPTIIVISAVATGTGRAFASVAGGLNTDDTIEPGPCTLSMSVGPTTSRAPFGIGLTGPDGTTVGNSTPAMAVGNTVSDRGN